MKILFGLTRSHKVTEAVSFCFLSVLVSSCLCVRIPFLCLSLFHANSHELSPQRRLKINPGCHCKGAPGDCGNPSAARLLRSFSLPRNDRLLVICLYSCFFVAKKVFSYKLAHILKVSLSRRQQSTPIFQTKEMSENR